MRSGTSHSPSVTRPSPGPRADAACQGAPRRPAAPAADLGSGRCARCALTANDVAGDTRRQATGCSSTWSRRLSRPTSAGETQSFRVWRTSSGGVLSLEASAAKRPGSQDASGAGGDDYPEAPDGRADSEKSGALRGELDPHGHDHSRNRGCSGNCRDVESHSLPAPSKVIVAGVRPGRIGVLECAGPANRSCRGLHARGAPIRAAPARHRRTGAA